MHHLPRAVVVGVGITLGLSVCAQSPAETRSPSEVEAQAKNSISAGDFLRLDLLTPRNLRRTSTFLAANERPQRLQVAFVLDGTETMREELASFQSSFLGIVKGLRRMLPPDGQLELAVLVYRDQASPSGPLTWLTDDFTDDLASISVPLLRLQVESGAPYFNEPVDTAVHSALDRLSWQSGNPQAVRWIVLCGDAPPYPEHAPKFRQHSTDSLLQLAEQRGVVVHGLLAETSLAAEQAEQVTNLRELRTAAAEFLSELASGTGGQFLDLSQTDDVQSWLEDTIPRAVSMPGISEQQIIELRQARQMATPRDFRLAILPTHKDAPRDLGADVQVATALRHKFRQLPGVAVCEATRVEKAVAELSAASPQARLGTAEQRAKLCQYLEVDLAIGGELTETDVSHEIQLTLYRAIDGEPVANVVERTPARDAAGQRDLVFLAATHLCQQAAAEFRLQPETTDLASTFAYVDRVDGAALLKAPLARDLRAQRGILIALDNLEHSLEYVLERPVDGKPSADSQGRPLNRAAISELKAALELEENNPFAHLLLASCYYNGQGDPELGDVENQFRQHLEFAWRHRRAGPSADERLIHEIEAEYALFITRDLPMAIGRYRLLSDPRKNGRTRSGVRACWMLAGIHLGDWGIEEHAPQQVKVSLARAEILQILAYWPDSPEAAFYRSCLAQQSHATRHIRMPASQRLMLASF